MSESATAWHRLGRFPIILHSLRNRRYHVPIALRNGVELRGLLGIRNIRADAWFINSEASCMEPIVICFWCRQHLNHAELANGQHNHVDERERLQAQAENKRSS